MARNDRLSNYRTTWFNNNFGGVRYVNTDIATWKITRSHSTQMVGKRHNQAQNEPSLKSIWFALRCLPRQLSMVRKPSNGQTVKYYDGITFEIFGG